MPQIEEVQFVHWGPFRPDTVPLAVDGINVATGPNGSGKTAFLDGIKLLLGTEHLKAKPTDYIYVSGGDEEGEPTERAHRALLRAVFANPEQGGGQGRLFADAGRGCEQAEFVTAVCEITRDKRRYLLMPGRVIWGGPDRDLETDLDRLRTVPNSHWLGPKKWQGLMARAGITRSLVQLMSMPQGETDKAIHGTPEELLRRALELTGRQQIIDDFRETKKALAESRARHRDTSERFKGEEQRLEALAAKVQRHNDFRDAVERVARIEGLELPVARHRGIEAEVARVIGERDGMARSVGQMRAEIARLDERIPALEAQLAEHQSRLAELDKAIAAARQESEAAVSQHTALDQELSGLVADRDGAGEHYQGSLDAALVEAAQRQATDAAVAAQRAREQIASTETEIEGLGAGRPALPDGLHEFREVLAAKGIASQVIAEHVETDTPMVSEAVLHDGLWGLVVAEGDFETAVGLAVEHDHHLPIVRAGDGAPHGALSGARGLDGAGAFLEELSLPLGEIPGVRDDGLVSGRSWAAWRRPDSPILGEQARRQALEDAEARLLGQQEALPSLEADELAGRERAEALRAGLRAQERLPELEQLVSAAAERRQLASERLDQLDGDRGDRREAKGGLETELRDERGRLEREKTQVGQSEKRLVTYDRQIEEIRERQVPLTEEQAGLDQVASEETLERELERLRLQLEDEERYPHEVRSQLIVAEHEDQSRRVAEIAELLEGRERDLEAVSAEVERARQRYLEHIRQVIGIVNRRFRELCERAGMEGQLQLVASADIEGEMGLEMKVAHVRGERLLSARHPHHSGGQRVKMAILLLLASMGVEGATDLLIMDEHSAHLDSRNIDHVAELMDSLKGQVQFVLAMPSHAEALRLSWCDHQLAFYQRSSHELYSPPVRLLTRLPDEGDTKYTERMGQLPVAL